jgi:hypothetical protein
MMPEMAFAPDMSGVCRVGGTANHLETGRTGQHEHEKTGQKSCVIVTSV